MGILQARILEWVDMPSSRGFSQASDRTQVSHIAREFFTVWATREALQMVTTAMNIEDSPWKKSYDKSGQCIKKQRHHFTAKICIVSIWFFQYSCTDVRVGPQRRLSAEELMSSNCSAGEDS